jgi:hypothetical protein
MQMSTDVRHGGMISPKDVLPIGFSTWAGATALIGRGGMSCAGQALNVYGAAVNRFRDFHAFVRKAIDIAKNRLAVRFCSYDENQLRQLEAEIIATDSPAEATAA